MTLPETTPSVQKYFKYHYRSKELQFYPNQIILLNKILHADMIGDSFVHFISDLYKK